MRFINPKSFLIATLLILFSFSTEGSYAQANIGDWSEPLLFLDLNIENNPGVLRNPVFITDSGNNLHAFFIAATGVDEPLLLYYTKFNNSNWNYPIDVLSSPDGVSIIPQIIIDPEDWIHVFWRSGSGDLLYSRAHASALAIVHNWSEPEEIFLPNRIFGEGQFSIRLNEQGNFEILYSTKDASIEYVVLEKESKSIISNSLIATPPDDQTWLLNAGFTTSSDGIIWAAWSETELDLRRKAVYYSTSQDNGANWDQPTLIASGYYSGGFTSIGEYLLKYYMGGVGTGGRYIAASKDNGNSWSLWTNITANQNQGEGMQGLSFALDSTGLLHVLEQTGGTFATVNLDGYFWTEPEYVLQSNVRDNIMGPVQNGSMAISNGNTVHVFWQAGGPSWNRELWYSQKILTAAYIESTVIPSPSDTSIVEIQESDSSDEDPTQNQNVEEINEQVLSINKYPDEIASDQTMPIAIATAIIIAFIVIVLIINLRTRKSSR